MNPSRQGGEAKGCGKCDDTKLACASGYSSKNHSPRCDSPMVPCPECTKEGLGERIKETQDEISALQDKLRGLETKKYELFGYEGKK